MGLIGTASGDVLVGSAMSVAQNSWVPHHKMPPLFTCAKIVTFPHMVDALKVRWSEKISRYGTFNEY